MPPTLVRPQTFTVLQQSDSASPAVRFKSFDLTSWFEYFTCSNTREQNLIYSLFEVLTVDLVFVYKNIVKQFKPLIFKDYGKSNSGSPTSPCFPLVGKTESLQQEAR